MSHPDNDQTFRFDVAVTVEGGWDEALLVMRDRLNEEREMGFNYYIDWTYLPFRRDA